MTSADTYEKFPTTYYFATASNTSGDITIPAYQSFTLVVNSNGLSSTGGTCQLVFNADTGSNYTNRFILLPAGSITAANTPNAAAAAFIFTPTSTTSAFTAVFNIQNYPTIAKTIAYRVAFLGTAAAPVTTFGGGDYVNTTAPITQIRMTTSANNYAVGSGFGVYGGDPL